MKKESIFLLSLFTSFFAFACLSEGQEGEFGEGWFRTSCGDQLPSLCDQIPLPAIAVGTNVVLFYEHERRGYLGDVHAVSEKLFNEAAWSAFYCSDPSNVLIYDFTRIKSEVIDELTIESTTHALVEPIEVNCSGDFPDNTFVVPIGTGGRKLMGVGSWNAHIVPEIAEVEFSGNEIYLSSLNDSGDDLSAVLTLSLSDGTGTTDFDLLVCSSPEVVEEPTETVVEESDASEVPDVHEEDIIEDGETEDLEEIDADDMSSSEED